MATLPFRTITFAVETPDCLEDFGLFSRVQMPLERDVLESLGTTTVSRPVIMRVAWDGGRGVPAGGMEEKKRR